MEFRLLRADEIECRVSSVLEDGIVLLLYKDARCDQNILDETVGCLNWQRHHSRDNANCIVSIWDNDKGRWIEKEDTGTESYTETEKGLASDSFKRACFNWGIGRELYTSPKFMFIENAMLKKREGRKVYDRFAVDDIAYTGRRIKSVTVRNTSNGKTKTFGDTTKKADEVKDEAKFRAEVLHELSTHTDAYKEGILKHYGVDSANKLTTENMKDYMKAMEDKKNE